MNINSENESINTQ